MWKQAHTIISSPQRWNHWTRVVSELFVWFESPEASRKRTCLPWSRRLGVNYLLWSLCVFFVDRHAITPPPHAQITFSYQPISQVSGPVWAAILFFFLRGWPFVLISIQPGRWGFWKACFKVYFFFKNICLLIVKSLNGHFVDSKCVLPLCALLFFFVLKSNVYFHFSKRAITNNYSTGCSTAMEQQQKSRGVR